MTLKKDNNLIISTKHSYHLIDPSPCWLLFVNGLFLLVYITSIWFLKLLGNIPLYFIVSSFFFYSFQKSFNTKYKFWLQNFNHSMLNLYGKISSTLQKIKVQLQECISNVIGYVDNIVRWTIPHYDWIPLEELIRMSKLPNPIPKELIELLSKPLVTPVDNTRPHIFTTPANDPDALTHTLGGNDQPLEPLFEGILKNEEAGSPAEKSPPAAPEAKEGEGEGETLEGIADLAGKIAGWGIDLVGQALQGIGQALQEVGDVLRDVADNGLKTFINDLAFGYQKVITGIITAYKNFINFIVELGFDIIEQLNILIRSTLPGISFFLSRVVTEFLDLLNGPYGIVLGVLFLTILTVVKWISSPNMLSRAFCQNALNLEVILARLSLILSGLSSLISLVLAAGLFSIIMKIFETTSFLTFFMISVLNCSCLIALFFIEVVSFCKSLYIYLSINNDFYTRFPVILTIYNKLKQQCNSIAKILFVIAGARFFYDLLVQRKFKKKN